MNSNADFFNVLVEAKNINVKYVKSGLGVRIVYEFEIHLGYPNYDYCNLFLDRNYTSNDLSVSPASMTNLKLVI